MENMVLGRWRGKRGVWCKRPNSPPTLYHPPSPPKVGDPPSAVALQVSFQSWLKHSKQNPRAGGRSWIIKGWVCGETASVSKPKMSSCCKQVHHLHGACNM